MRRSVVRAGVFRVQWKDGCIGALCPRDKRLIAESQATAKITPIFASPPRHVILNSIAQTIAQAIA